MCSTSTSRSSWRPRTSISTMGGPCCSTRRPRSRHSGRRSTTHPNPPAGSSVRRWANGRRGTGIPKRWATTPDEPDAVAGRRMGMRIFFATDIHGSEVCWRKFLNAGKFHKADVLIMGGDMTGKAMVPIVANGSNWELELQGQHHVLTTDDELRAMEKRISDRGYYPIRLTRDEVDAWAADAKLVDARFQAVMLDNVERWMALGDERLAGTGIRCIVSPANDDIFELDPIIARAEHLELGEGNTIALDGFTLVSTGYANPTPWNTYRELTEPELRERID